MRDQSGMESHGDTQLVSPPILLDLCTLAMFASWACKPFMTEFTGRNMAECIICVHVRVICFMCMNVCLCTTQKASVHRDQKDPSDPLELELLMVVSHHVGAGTQTQVLYKEQVCSTMELSPQAPPLHQLLGLTVWLWLACRSPSSASGGLGQRLVPPCPAGSVVGLMFLCLHQTGEKLGTYSASCRCVENNHRDAS